MPLDLAQLRKARGARRGYCLHHGPGACPLGGGELDRSGFTTVNEIRAWRGDPPLAWDVWAETETRGCREATPRERQQREARWLDGPPVPEIVGRLRAWREAHACHSTCAG